MEKIQPYQSPNTLNLPLNSLHPSQAFDANKQIPSFKQVQSTVFPQNSNTYNSNSPGRPNPSTPQQGFRESPEFNSDNTNNIQKGAVYQNGNEQKYKNKYSFKRKAVDNQGRPAPISNQKPAPISSVNSVPTPIPAIVPTVVPAPAPLPPQKQYVPYQIKQTRVQSGISVAQHERIVSAHQSRIRQLQLLLAKIRDISLSRKLECQKKIDQSGDVLCLNTLIQIYNTSIGGTNLTTINYYNTLNYYNNNKLPPFVQPPPPLVQPPPPRPSSVIVYPTPQRPYIPPNYIHVNPPPNFIRPQPQIIINPASPPTPGVAPGVAPVIVTPAVAPVAPVVKPAITPAVAPVAPVVDHSQKYLVEIRELRIRVEVLESQKSQLIDQLRYYERQHYKNDPSQIIRVYRDQIERLKETVMELTTSIHTKDDKELSELKVRITVYIQREKEYEQQLIEAQKHIIWLQNNNNKSHLQSQVKTLRQNIANYTEHIEHIESQKKQLRNTISTKDQQLARLQRQIQSLHIEISQKSKEAPAPAPAPAPASASENTIDPDSYYNLVAQFGRKQLQTIFLLQEINRLNTKYQEIRGFLQRAEDFIFQLQNNNQNTSINSEKIGKLEQALEQQYKNQNALKEKYQLQIKRITNINIQLNQQITTLTQQITTFTQQITNYQIEIKRITTINIQLNQQQTTTSTQQITTLENEIKRITNINIQLNQQITTLTQQITTFTQQITNYQIEIKRITTINTQLNLQQTTTSTQQITTLQNEIKRITNINIQLNQQITTLTQQITNYQIEIKRITNINIQLNQQIITYEIEITRITNINIELTQQITIIQTQITNISNTNVSMNQSLAIQAANKTFQVVILLEQINRLKSKIKQLEEKIQGYDFQLLGYQTREVLHHSEMKQLRKKYKDNVTSPLSPTKQPQLNKNQSRQYQQRIAQANQVISAYKAKQANGTTQAQAVQAKYKGIIAHLDKNYAEIQEERNSLILKIKELSKDKVATTDVTKYTQRIKQLQQTNEQLNIRVVETTQHLVNAEIYIRQNIQQWQRQKGSQKQPQIAGIIEQLNKDLQVTERRNISLSQRIQQLESIISRNSENTAQNQNMTIIIREKQEVEVLQSDRHAQIEQVELTLKNYINLYNQAQAKLVEAERQIAVYKADKKKLTQLEATLKKTEEFIKANELKWNNFEKENTEVKNHLIGAETYILELEQKLARLNKDKNQIIQLDKRHAKQNADLQEALKRAEQYIFSLQHVK